MSAARKMARATARRVVTVPTLYRCLECGMETKSRHNLGPVLTMRHRTKYGQEFCKSPTFSLVKLRY